MTHYIDYILASDRAKNSALFAGCWAAATWPASWSAFEHFDNAWRYYCQGKNLEQYAAENESLEQAAAQSEFAGVNYNAALKEGAFGLVCSLIVGVPIALLARRFFRNRKMAREFNVALNQERLAADVKMVGSSIDNVFEKK